WVPLPPPAEARLRLRLAGGSGALEQRQSAAAAATGTTGLARRRLGDAAVAARWRLRLPLFFQPFGEFQQPREGARRVIHASGRVTDLGEPAWHGVDGENRGIAVRDLVPGQRRRDPRVGGGADGVRRSGGAVPSV